MIRDYPGEKWKLISFDFEVTNSGTIEVSSFGRVKTNNKINKDRLLNGSLINGYKIIRLRLYTPRTEAIQKKLDAAQRSVFKLQRELKSLKDNKASKTEIKELTEIVAEKKTILSKQFTADLNKRTINWHSLVHRLVAEYFLPKPSTSRTIVAHKNFDKLDNKMENLVWMTVAENSAHQQKSPYVIKERAERPMRNHTHFKLTVTRVMLLKKLLNNNKPIKNLAKQFKVTETQIRRIQKGENWSSIPAAT
jgi:hypothetical protein